MTRKERIGRVERIVVKVGTSLLSDTRLRLDRASLAAVVANVMDARRSGAQAVLVTSGAVGAGMGLLGFERRPSLTVEKQACAAVGQSQLMHEYQRLFAKQQVVTAQVLLTRGDVTDRRGHQNVRRVMDRLLDRGVVPIVNENDVVADDEIDRAGKFGDNDTLSGLVADLVEADMLVILTDVDGLYEDRAARRRVPVVTAITPEIFALAGGAGSAASTGGMVTKIRTAERMARAGRVTVIASGREEGIMRRILEGEDVGTLFLPAGKRLEARKRWIADHLVARGRIVVDAGCAEALRRRGGSLLPGGIRGVEGTFAPGSAVEIVDEGGTRIGQGLCRYSGREIARIKGERSDRIESRLGHSRGAEVIHRDDLVIDGES